MLSLQPGQKERHDLMSQSGDSVQVMDEENTEHFGKYNANQKTDESSEEKQQNLLDLFGEDACIRKSSSGIGILLDESQTKVLGESWRIKAPNGLSAYKDSYRSSFPVNEKSEEMLKVPSLDDIIETFFIRRHSPKATFKKSRGLFTQHLKEMEKLAFKGQTAARMGIVITLYMQQALASLLSELDSENSNLDRATQTIRDVFAMSTKVLDQFGRTGAYDHYIHRKATIVDIGLDTVKDVAKHSDMLPLTGDGVFGKEFETKLKDRKEKNKEYKDLVPEIGKRDFQNNLKRKAQPMNNNENQKQRRFNNSKTGGNYNQNRSDYNTRFNNRSSGSSYSKFSGQQKKSYTGVSPGITVLEVKKLLQDQVSIPVEQQKLIFQGKQLADDKDLSHYKVGDGAKLFLMLKKPGSGVTPSTSSTPSSSKSAPQTPTTFPRTTEQEAPPFTIDHDPTGFWEKLTTFLKRHFTEKDALKVLQVFKKDFDNGMCNMSLDDIERLAAARLRLTQGYCHEKKIR